MSQSHGRCTGMKITRVYSNKPRIAFSMIQNEGPWAYWEGACFHPHKNAMRLEAASLNWHHMETSTDLHRISTTWRLALVRLGSPLNRGRSAHSSPAHGR